MNNKKTSDTRTTGDLQSLSQIILPLTKKIAGKNGFIEIEVLTNWPDIVGEQMAKYSLPQKIIFPHNQKNNGCLHLAVPTGAFAVEIQHREKYILEKVNTFFGYKAVSSLKIIQNNELCLIENKSVPTQPNLTPEITPEEDELIKNMCKNINNENLKEILIKLGHSVYTNNHKTEK